jgi:uncharacterized protein (DUF983 family)
MKNHLYSVLHDKCPKCNKGNFFEVSNPYALKAFDKMNGSCNHCHEDFRRETGFYIGAMYASYGLTVMYGIILFLLMVTLLKLNVWVYLATFSVSLILLLPLIYRKSRLIWINLFVKYKK